MLGFQVHPATVSPEILKNTKINNKWNKECNKTNNVNFECITLNALHDRIETFPLTPKNQQFNWANMKRIFVHWVPNTFPMYNQISEPISGSRPDFTCLNKII